MISQGRTGIGESWQTRYRFADCFGWGPAMKRPYIILTGKESALDCIISHVFVIKIMKMFEISGREENV